MISHNFFVHKLLFSFFIYFFDTGPISRNFCLQARRQKSFAGPMAKKIAQLKSPSANINTNNTNTTNLTRRASMPNLDKSEEKIVRVRSLVEVEDYDGM